MESTSKIYDLSKLEQLFRGNSALVEKTVKTFCKETGATLPQLRTELEAQNWDQVRAIAHRLKPSIEMLQIGTLGPDVRNIEEYAGEQTNMEQLPALVSKFISVCTQAIQELEREFNIN